MRGAISCYPLQSFFLKSFFQELSGASSGRSARSGKK